MLFKLIKSSSITQLILRYVAEIIIIFVGITVSFIFDQWREDIKKKKDLVELSQALLTDIDALKIKLKEDLIGSSAWIRQLDSLRNQRTSKKFSDLQLKWFYKMATGQYTFLFDPYSPTYMAAVSTGTISELPEKINNQLYKIYRVNLPLFQLLYNQQQENILNFRNTTMLTANSYLYTTEISTINPDLKLLAEEIQRPAYGNFINQVIITEREVYKLNEDIFKSLTEAERSLRDYVDMFK
ncbi:MAG TPA: hypothetical protein PKJ83_11725 [Cyclobacteriaceae bacterium]|nr:hypothetical protein [Cyclobacteriaceae bacterium]HPW63356.1 hypothetical protein [Cyclobacteriaceae bacterium]